MCQLLAPLSSRDCAAPKIGVKRIGCSWCMAFFSTSWLAKRGRQLAVEKSFFSIINKLGRKKDVMFVDLRVFGLGIKLWRIKAMEAKSSLRRRKSVGGLVLVELHLTDIPWYAALAPALDGRLYLKFAMVLVSQRCLSMSSTSSTTKEWWYILKPVEQDFWNSISHAACPIGFPNRFPNAKPTAWWVN